MLSNKLKTTFFLIALVLHSFVLLKEVRYKLLPDKKKTAKVEKRVRLKLKKPKPLVKPKKKPQQIVNTEKQKNKSRPKKAKYLSHSNQSFERETVAAKTGRYKEAGKGTTRKKAPKVTVQKQQKKPKKVVKAQKQRKVKKNGKLSFSDLAPTAFKVPPKPKPKPKKIAAKQGLKNGNKKKKGLSQNNDFVEDVKLGDMTRLNTQEFKYYGFYHRIRQKLEQYWENTLRQKVDSIYRQGRRVASNKEKITSLRIVLDKRGRIVDVQVRASSGVKELDEAAIESFNKAGPFPNPPKGMVKNGTATLDWGFVVKS